MWTEEIPDDIESMDDDDKQILTFTIGRYIEPGQKVATGEWRVDISFGGVDIGTDRVNLPSVGLAAAIAHVEKRFGIKISDK